MATSKAKHCSLVIDSQVVRQIRQHARSQMKTEVCGVLIGNKQHDVVHVEACIAGVNATQAGTHVTFTQDTWEHVYKIKDKEFPDERIVGWYHSHPGFGVFLSDHDTFIHKNFFSSPDQVAWVYDPHSDEEGCFGWIGERLERIEVIEIRDRRGGELVDTNPRPEPSILDIDNEDEQELVQFRPEARASNKDQDTFRLHWTSVVLSHVAVFLLALFISWVVFPTIFVVPVDPLTGKPLTPPIQLDRFTHKPIEGQYAISDPTDKAGKQQPPSNDATKRNDGNRQQQ